MKKLYSFIALLAAVITFTACGDDDATYTPTPKLDVQSASLEFEAGGGVNSVVLNTTATVTAVVETGSEWLTAAVSGNQVSLSAAANTSLSGRSATILLKSGGAEVRLTATQKGIIYGVPEGLTYSFSDAADTLAIPVDHTTDVQIQSLAEWITATFNAEADAIEIIVPENEESDDRFGLVAIATGSVKDTMLIVQKGMSYQVSVTAPSIPTNEAGSTVVSVKHSKELTAESLNPDWLSVAIAPIENGSELTISATANETGSARLGRIRIATGSIVDTLVVTQMDLASEVYGNYVFVYEDLTAESEEEMMQYVSAELNDSALLVDDLVIPAKVNMETGVISFGPCGSLIGTFPYQGMTLGLYLRWLNMSGSLLYSGFSNTADVAEGTLAVEEEVDEDGTYYYTMMNIGGSFEDGNAIHAWCIAACAGDYAEDNYAGVLAYYGFPYMIKVPNTTAPAAVVKSIAKKNAHKTFLNRYGRNRNSFKVIGMK